MKSLREELILNLTTIHYTQQLLRLKCEQQNLSDDELKYLNRELKSIVDKIDVLNEFLG